MYSKLIGNYDILLRGRCKNVVVYGKEKSQIKTTGVYLDKYTNNNEIVKYYKELIEGEYTKEAALIKALLCQKNITYLYNDDKELSMKFEKEPYFFDKKTCLKVDLNSKNVKDYKEELLLNANKNFIDSRMQFIFDNAEENYVINNYSKKRSFEKFNDKCIIDFNENNMYDKKFIHDMLQMLMENNNNYMQIEYKDVIINNKEDYAKGIVIYNGNFDISINLLSAASYVELRELINEYNLKLEEKSAKRKELVK